MWFEVWVGGESQIDDGYDCSEYSTSFFWAYAADVAAALELGRRQRAYLESLDDVVANLIGVYDEDGLRCWHWVDGFTRDVQVD